jgi:hypothetical protein
VRKVDISDEDIDKILKKKLWAKDVKVCELFIQRSRNGIFVRCDVSIEPMQRNTLENTNFEFGHCKVVPIFGLLWDFTTPSYLVEVCHKTNQVNYSSHYLSYTNIILCVK